MIGPVLEAPTKARSTGAGNNSARSTGAFSTGANYTDAFSTGATSTGDTYLHLC